MLSEIYNYKERLQRYKRIFSTRSGSNVGSYPPKYISFEAYIMYIIFYVHIL